MENKKLRPWRTS